MGLPYVGEIAYAGFNFAPPGWSFCNGQLVPISQETVLFQLIGTTYGGNGTTNFNLPDLQGRMSIHQGQGVGLSPYALGQRAGNETEALTANALPQHTHAVRATTATASSQTPSGNILAAGHDAEPTNPIQIPHIYLPFVSGMPTVNMSAVSIQSTGSNTPAAFSVIQPILAVNSIIALQGVFPSQN